MRLSIAISAWTDECKVEWVEEEYAYLFDGLSEIEMTVPSLLKRCEIWMPVFYEDAHRLSFRLGPATPALSRCAMLNNLFNLTMKMIIIIKIEPR